MDGEQEIAILDPSNIPAALAARRPQFHDKIYAAVYSVLVLIGDNGEGGNFR
jgi:hypothetical protein